MRLVGRSTYARPSGNQPDYKYNQQPSYGIYSHMYGNRGETNDQGLHDLLVAAAGLGLGVSRATGSVHLVTASVQRLWVAAALEHNVEGSTAEPTEPVHFDISSIYAVDGRDTDAPNHAAVKGSDGASAWGAPTHEAPSGDCHLDAGIRNALIEDVPGLPAGSPQAAGSDVYSDGEFATIKHSDAEQNRDDRGEAKECAYNSLAYEFEACGSITNCSTACDGTATPPEVAYPAVECDMRDEFVDGAPRPARSVVGGPVDAAHVSNMRDEEDSASFKPTQATFEACSGALSRNGMDSSSGVTPELMPSAIDVPHGHEPRPPEVDLLDEDMGQTLRCPLRTVSVGPLTATPASARFTLPYGSGLGANGMPSSKSGDSPGADEHALGDGTSVIRSIADLRLDPDTPAQDAGIDRVLEKVQHERIFSG